MLKIMLLSFHQQNLALCYRVSLFLFFSNPIAPAVFCCLLSSPPPHPPLNTWHEPAIKSEVTSALCTALCDPAPAVRYVAVSAVQNLVTIAGLPIDDAPQLLPPLCMNRFHHADGVKTVAHVSGNSSTALFALYSPPMRISQLTLYSAVVLR